MTKKNREGFILAAACLMLATPGTEAAELIDTQTMAPLFTRGLSGECRGQEWGAPALQGGCKAAPAVQRLHLFVRRARLIPVVTSLPGGDNYSVAGYPLAGPVDFMVVDRPDAVESVSGQLTWRFLRDYSVELQLREYHQSEGDPGRETGVRFNASF